MTAAQALAAHASAQMAAARAADEARRMMDEIDREPVEECPSFVETWDVHATVIGLGH